MTIEMRHQCVPKVFLPFQGKSKCVTSVTTTFNRKVVLLYLIGWRRWWRTCFCLEIKEKRWGRTGDAL